MPVSRKSNKRNKFSKRSKNVRTIKKTRKHIRKMQGGGHCIEHIYRDRIGDTFLFQDSEKEYKLTKCLTYGPNLYYELISNIPLF